MIFTLIILKKRLNEGVFFKMDNKWDSNFKSDLFKLFKKEIKKLKLIKVKSMRSYYKLLTIITHVIFIILINQKADNS